MKLAQIFGQINAPPGVNRFNSGNLEGGLPMFLSVILRTMIMGAGIYALINFILAGYDYLGSEGDPKRIANASQKITLSIVGLLIAAGAFVIASIIGLLIFGDASAIISIRIFGP